MAETPTIKLENFPYLGRVKNSIDQLKKLVDLLNVRKELAKSDWETLSPYMQNEREITVLKTELELARVHKNIIEKENYLDQYINHVNKNMAEMEKNWDWIMEQSKKIEAKDPVWAGEVEAVDKSDFDTNFEYKLAHYLSVKAKVNPSKNAMRKVE